MYNWTKNQKPFQQYDVIWNKTDNLTDTAILSSDVIAYRFVRTFCSNNFGEHIWVCRHTLPRSPVLCICLHTLFPSYQYYMPLPLYFVPHQPVLFLCLYTFPPAHQYFAVASILFPRHCNRLPLSQQSTVLPLNENLSMTIHKKMFIFSEIVYMELFIPFKHRVIHDTCCITQMIHAWYKLPISHSINQCPILSLFQSCNL